MLRDYDAIFFVIVCTIWQITLCLTNIFNEASAQIKCKICNHKRISRDWTVLAVLPPRWRISMPNESEVQCKRLPNSFASKLRHGSRLSDSRTSPFICYSWVRHVTKSTSTYATYISCGSLLWSLSRILCLCMQCIIEYACTNCFPRLELQQYGILD